MTHSIALKFSREITSGALKARLEDIIKSFDVSQQIQNDPLSIVLRFKEDSDREVMALIAAVFAYGNVKQIQSSLEKILPLLGSSPALTLKKSHGEDWAKRIPKSFKHRFNTSQDLGILLTWIGEALRSHGTLENFFWNQLKDSKNNSGSLDKNAKHQSDIGTQLDDFLFRFISQPCAPFKLSKSKGALFFFPRPANGSACKRPLLFLRWVTGDGPMDLKLWKNFPRDKMVIPLDTHVLRISRHLGFTKRKDNSWRTALEVTNALKKLDPHDPTRFDFAICHLGISKECPSRYDKAVCRMCRMNDVCQTFLNEKRRKAP